MPTIVVLVKHVPDSWSTKTLEEDFTLDRQSVDEVIDEINEHAMEQALRIKEADPEAGWKVVALTVGASRADGALRKAIAMGADDAILVTDEAIAGSDLLGTAWAINQALGTVGEVDLIVAGNASTDGKMGALAGVLSEYRQIPALTNLNSVTCDAAARTVAGQRETSAGCYDISAPLPAIISVTERSGKARFPNFKGIMAAKKAQITVLDAAACGIDPATVGLAHAATAVTGVIVRPERTRGEIIHDTGDAAIRIADYLVEQRLL